MQKLVSRNDIYAHDFGFYIERGHKYYLQLKKLIRVGYVTCECGYLNEATL